MRLLVLLICLLSTPAVAADADPEAVAAEQTRLQEELQKLASKNAWKGVERTYARILELQVALPVDVHLLAARSGQALGDTMSAYVRLQRAIAVDPYAVGKDGPLAEVHAQLRNIDENYGRVHLQVMPGKKATLERAEMPFATDQRNSIEHVQAVVAKNRVFRGYLPAGDYTVDGVAFTVEPKSDWQQVVIAK